MALGGGIWTTGKMNKVLPGVYTKLETEKVSAANVSDRGTVAIPIEFDWLPDNEVITVHADDLQTNSLETFGYPYTHEKLMPLRELFLGAKEILLYKINSGGKKASSAKKGKAKYTGVRGNDLSVVVEKSILSTEEKAVFNVIVLLEDMEVFKQDGVSDLSELEENAFIEWNESGELTENAGVKFTGGENGEVKGNSYDNFFKALESKQFNVLGVPSKDELIKQLAIQWTQRQHDEVGKYFQTVLYKEHDADNELIISVENSLKDEKEDKEDEESANLIYWTAGKCAGSPINASLDNKIYNGELDIDTKYTQRELEALSVKGAFVYHEEGDNVRVLQDINTHTTFTSAKSNILRENKVVRMNHQSNIDVANIFKNSYLGLELNDSPGRSFFRSDVVDLYETYVSMRAIEDFDPKTDIHVEKPVNGNKGDVYLMRRHKPTGVMTHLYNDVVVS